MGYEEIPQPPVVRVTDDWTGEEIAPDTKPLNITIDGQRLSLYLGADSKAEVQGLVRKIVQAGGKAKGKRAGSGSAKRNRTYVSEAEQAQRQIEKEAYAKAHGKDPDTSRWNQAARDWYNSQANVRKAS